MELTFDTDSLIKHKFWTPDDFPPEDGMGLLVIDFSGEVNNSRKAYGGYEYITAMIGAARATWQPEKLVLNLTELEYEWGDGFTAVIGIARAKNLLGVDWQKEEIPLAIVVSDLCREGIESLLNDEMTLQPSDYLVDTIPEALKLLESK